MYSCQHFSDVAVADLLDCNLLTLLMDSCQHRWNCMQYTPGSDQPPVLCSESSLPSSCTSESFTHLVQELASCGGRLPAMQLSQEAGQVDVQLTIHRPFTVSFSILVRLLIQLVVQACGL